MPTILDRIEKIEAQRDEQSRYKVTYAGGKSSIETEIVPILSTVLQETNMPDDPQKATPRSIVKVEIISGSGDGILSKLAMDLLNNATAAP